ncbi:MAG TPA: ankyrin repeat domain-containing protein [Parafilimonas sp.]|nr:ankyrin repeat domain-containing protein [Parafilimonas sp.]
MKALLVAYILTLFVVNEKTVQNQNMENSNQSSIIKSVEQNRLEEVEKALKNGVDVNTQNGKKQSLLLIATRNGNFEMAKLIVGYGGDVNLRDEIADSPFLYAGASGKTAFVKLFLGNGARFDVFNRYNGTALIPACERGHVETVKLLANTKGFPIDHVNKLGWTALMEAVILGNGSKKYQEVVKILMDAGCNVNIPDKDGVTPLQHAEAMGFKEIAAILKSK